MTKAERKWDQGELDLFSAGRAETPSSKSAAGVLAALGLEGGMGPGGGEEAPVSGFQPQSTPAPISAPRASGIFSRPLAWVGGGVLLALVPAAFLLDGSSEATNDLVQSSPPIVEEARTVAQTPRGVSSDATPADDGSVVQLAELTEEPASPNSGSKNARVESATSKTEKVDEAAPRPSLAEELAIIKQARDRLSSGDLRGAESALSEHTQKFQPPRLSSEARVIRVEILMKQGKVAEAKQMAAPLMKENSPYRARMETLFSSP